MRKKGCLYYNVCNPEKKIHKVTDEMFAVSEYVFKTFENFLSLITYLFLRLRCFLRIAMHHLTLPKQVGAAAHQLKAIWVRSAAARRIRLSFFRLL